MFFKLSKAHFRFTNCLVHDSCMQGACFFVMHMWHQKLQQGTQKGGLLEFLILSALKLPSCGLVVFINMNTYRLTPGTLQKAQISKHS